MLRCAWSRRGDADAGGVPEGVPCPHASPCPSGGPAVAGSVPIPLGDAVRDALDPKLR
ncbi:hypothetical protein [Streptomyces sp. Ru71]|uniref:hypothetical protein n=1 Tax=Streptomyces sp. Ru71 TaxID=2080746 RepID=UPI0015E3C6DF|nr:hypothetical protein [Streptomyces sp. Ru71]